MAEVKYKINIYVVEPLFRDIFILPKYPYWFSRYNIFLIGMFYNIRWLAYIELSFRMRRSIRDSGKMTALVFIRLGNRGKYLCHNCLYSLLRTINLKACAKCTEYQHFISILNSATKILSMESCFLQWPDCDLAKPLQSSNEAMTTSWGYF